VNKTSIEWCTMTWNVLRGCSWASPGCDHYYAEAVARRFGKAGQPCGGCYGYEADSWSGDIRFEGYKLVEPLVMKKTRSSSLTR
jgi:protein gp37